MKYGHCKLIGIYVCVPAADFQCNVPLGMESGRISNMQISASSTYSDGRWTPQQSRLNSDDNGWTPNVDSNKEYLQVRTLSTPLAKWSITLLN